jgi:hypothetical protein
VLGEVGGRVHDGQFLGHGRDDELIQADAFLAGQLLDRSLDRARQAQRIGGRLAHFDRRLKASRGSSTRIPKRAGAGP